MSEFVEIFAGESRAKISLQGAELKSWTVAGRELIWRGDEKFWADSAPILFPVVGWTRDGIVVLGERYPLGLHGFARTLEFSVRERSANHLLCRLAASPATRALYPFEFVLDVEYFINANELNIIIHVKNEDRKILPYACGVHPGFAWPLPGAAGPHFIRFDREERAEVPIIAPGGLFSTKTRALPMKGRELALTPDLFEEALCLIDARSAGLDFYAIDANGEAKPSLRLELDNFPHIALWSRPGAPFLCLEAWTGYGDPEGFTGDVFAKPSMRFLQPEERARSAATFLWRA